MSEQTPAICVIGTGYLGVTHAVGMAELGFDVLGLDVDEGKVEDLRAGRLPFFEPDLAQALEHHVRSGRLRFTTSFKDVAAFGDVHFVCVGTPQHPASYAVDLTHVEHAFAALAPLLTRRALVVGKSTVPTGTAARMGALVASLAPCSDVELAWNPEFLREGAALHDTLHPDRLVLGVQSTWAEQQLRRVYQQVIGAGTPVITMDFATAELVKVASNAFLATKISFINAMAEVCEAVGADVMTLADAMGRDARIGRRNLSAGLGFGGGCLPKDIRGFIARGEDLGLHRSIGFLRDVDEINQRRRVRALELGAQLLGSDYRGARVAVLGAAFKPDSDDIRDSPALEVAVMAHDRGAHVTVYDPKAMDAAQKAQPQLSFGNSTRDAMRGADLVLLLTDWAQFRAISPTVARSWVRAPRIVDARNALDPARWSAAGWSYRALGRGAGSAAAGQDELGALKLLDRGVSALGHCPANRGEQAPFAT